MRKNITVNESPLKALSNKKTMNDIMYYLRRLLKLARKLQTGMLREGCDPYIDSEIQECLKEVRDLINNVDSRVE